MQNLKEKLSTLASKLLKNTQGLMPSFNFDWSTFTDSLEGYVEARLAIIKLELKEALTDFTQRLAYGAIILLLASLALMLFSIGASMMLNKLTDSQYAGFLIMAGLYIAAAFGITMYAKYRIFGPKEDEKPEPVPVDDFPSLAEQHSIFEAAQVSKPSGNDDLPPLPLPNRTVTK